MAKSFKKKPIVAGSPAIQEHEAMMSQVLTDEQPSPVSETSPSGSGLGGSLAEKSTGAFLGIFSSARVEPMKNVQTRVPFSTYEKLNRMKYALSFAGQRISIGDIVATAIREYVERNPVQ